MSVTFSDLKRVEIAIRDTNDAVTRCERTVQQMERTVAEVANGAREIGEQAKEHLKIVRAYAEMVSDLARRLAVLEAAERVDNRPPTG